MAGSNIKKKKKKTDVHPLFVSSWIVSGKIRLHLCNGGVVVRQRKERNWKDGYETRPK